MREVVMELKTVQKQKMLLRKTEPVKAKIYGMVLDGAKKIAKDASREAEDADLITAAKRLIKSLEKTNITLKEHGVSTAENDAEIELLKEFMPPQLVENQVKQILTEYIASLPEDQQNKKSMGKIMGMMRGYGDQVDMAMVSKLLNGMLS
jgi:uncharacterized protein YqeY